MAKKRCKSPATTCASIDALKVKYPGIRARLCDGDAIRGISVVIDSQISRAGLTESVNENSEVHFIPAIAGG